MGQANEVVEGMQVTALPVDTVIVLLFIVLGTLGLELWCIHRERQWAEREERR
jgi:hypothetical protein